MTLRRTLQSLLAILALAAAHAATALPSVDSEDELKAATVWLFVQYSHLTPGTDGSITVGVVGRPSFEQTLRHTLEGKFTAGHPVRVVEARNDFRTCQMVYLATDKAEDVHRVLTATQPLRILVIGESNRFLERGGAVNLFIADGHISFEASLDALDRSGVSISSNLLKFGQIRDRGKGPVKR